MPGTCVHNSISLTIVILYTHTSTHGARNVYIFAAHNKSHEHMNTNNKPENRNEALKAILRKSHAQALAGETYSMYHVEHFMNKKIYELEHRMPSIKN